MKLLWRPRTGGEAMAPRNGFAGECAPACSVRTRRAANNAVSAGIECAGTRAGSPFVPAGAVDAEGDLMTLHAIKVTQHGQEGVATVVFGQATMASGIAVDALYAVVQSASICPDQLSTLARQATGRKIQVPRLGRRSSRKYGRSNFASGARRQVAICLLPVRECSPDRQGN